MNILEEYEKAKQKIYDHVGLEEDWVVCPLDFFTGKPWQVSGLNVKYADSLEDFHSDGNYYMDSLYTQRFYEKHVYRGEEYTLVFCDSHVDGMKWWRIFENKHEVK